MRADWLWWRNGVPVHSDCAAVTPCGTAAKEKTATTAIGIDLTGGSNWFEAVIKEKLPGGGRAMPTQRWEPLQRPDHVFTSAQLAAAIATPENLRASLAKHGRVIFVLCQNEGEERDRLRREGVDTDRIKFVVLPEVPKCGICGDLAHYEQRCHRHKKGMAPLLKKVYRP